MRNLCIIFVHNYTISMKKLLLPIISICFVIVTSCQKEIKPNRIQLRGNVFGTTYNIVYLGDTTNYQTAIDSLFNAVNNSLSTYIPTSDISKINEGNSEVLVDDFFIEVFQKSKRIYTETNGYFDPTVGNLVNAWGFGPEKGMNNLDSIDVKDQMKYVGLNKVKIINRKVVKQFPEIYLDFNSIAKGFGIDVIGRFLEDKKIKNYLVEIGGEVRARGISLKQKPWKIGIDHPNTDDTRTIGKLVELSDQSIASSGNYRKFRISEDGKRYVHTINPKTGFATESNLLSATVIAASDCADVDAYATAFMAMGLEKTKDFLERFPEIKVVLMYIDHEGNLTEYSTYKN